MTDETWEIKLGDETYVVPRLPLKASRIVYPICQKLTNNDLPARIIGKMEAGVFMPPSSMEITDEELDMLIKVALAGAQAADPTLTAEAFEEMTITPPQLYDAFFAMRYACGGWRMLVEGKKPSGEATETEDPPS